MTKRIDLELILTLAARIEGIRTQMAKLDEELSEAKAEMQSAVTGDEPKPEPTPIVAEVTVTELPPLTDKEADAVLVEVYTQRIARGGLQAEEYQRRLVNLEQRNA